MQTARDTATTQICGKVTLVQEIDSDVQPGFLMYLPYTGSPPGDFRWHRDSGGNVDV
jgi:hypothetical protein